MCNLFIYFHFTSCLLSNCLFYAAEPLRRGIGSLNERRSLVIRLTTGFWCLTCFVRTHYWLTAYCSVLVSFLAAPSKPLGPIITSIDDLPNHPEIKVNVMKGRGPDLLFQVMDMCFYFRFRSADCNEKRFPFPFLCGV